MTILPAALSILLLAALATPGIALLDRFARWLTPLERFAHGSVLGIVAGTLAMVPVAVVAGFGPLVVIGVGAGCVLVAALIRYVPGGPPRVRDGRSLGERAFDLLARLDPLASGLMLVLAIRWFYLWTSVLTVGPDGLWAGHLYIWSDWPTHIGIVARFAWGDNFPPVNTLYAGLPLSYHYLSDLTPAAFVVLGMDPVTALPLHSYALSMLVALGIWAFVRRLTLRPAAATLATFLFLFGAGLGWLIVLGQIDQGHDLLGVLAGGPWDPSAHKGDLNLWIFNPYLAFLMSQRAFIYGMPLAMLAVTLLTRAARRRHLGTFALAGVVAGLIPLAHLPTLLAMAMMTPFLVFLLAPGPFSFWRMVGAVATAVAGLIWLATMLTLLASNLPADQAMPISTILLALGLTAPFVAVFVVVGPWNLRRIPWIGWIAFHGIWIAVALPQLATQLGGGAGAIAAFRPELGWAGVIKDDSWPWFWLKNTGLFIPLAVLAFFARRAVPPRSLLVLLAFMALFVIANLFIFQPWDWDNHKILIFWLLGVAALGGALLAKTWRDHGTAVVRLLIVVAIATMVMDPLLENLTQWEGYGRYRMLSDEQLRIARQIRDVTAPSALLVTSWEHDDPVQTLTGRQVLMGYWGQLYVSKIPYQAREDEIREILKLGPGADETMRRDKVDYVVIGPELLTDVPDADTAGFQRRFPVVAATEHYTVFDVRSVSRG